MPLPPEKVHLDGYDLRRRDEREPGYWQVDGSEDEKRVPQCGAFFLHMDIWYRGAPWIGGPNKKQFTEHLDAFGGISIYRDGINIFPAEWGAEVDWLRLSKRHIKKGINLSYYNMVGYLEIEQDVNLTLVDKTDRQGLLENRAFRDLGSLVRNAVLWVEPHFTGRRNALRSLTTGLIREPKKLGEVTRQGALLVDRIVQRYDIAEDAQRLLERLGDVEGRRDRLVNLSLSLKAAKKSLEVMQEVQDSLSEAAGYGLAIGVAVHEVAKITSNFYTGVAALLKSGRMDRSRLIDLKEAASSLKSELKRFAPFRAIRNEPAMAFDIRKAIRFCKSVFQKKFEKLRVAFEVVGEGSFSVYARYGAVNQILSNLIDNSCYWLAASLPQTRAITVGVDGPNRTLVVADSGPDVDASVRPYLFEPGYSLKVPPSGLGLYVCRYYMQAMGGSIHEASRRDRIPSLDGAQFVLDFSRVLEREAQA